MPRPAAPTSARGHLLALVEAEADARWQHAHAAPDDRRARRAFEAMVELRVFLAGLPADAEDALVLSALAPDVFQQELHGLLALHGRRLDAEPCVFLGAVLKLATDRALERAFAGIG